MIKLKRGECPKELTQDVCDELTKLYKENKDRDVWNSPKIKTGLKNALMGRDSSEAGGTCREFCGMWL